MKFIIKCFSFSNAKNCLYPGLPANGKVSPAPNSGGTYLPGSVVRFSCNSGYKIEGSQMMFCQLSGTWFGTTPYCLRNYILC